MSVNVFFNDAPSLFLYSWIYEQKTFLEIYNLSLVAYMVIDILALSF